MKAIILAAGEGKRMNSDLPKVLHKICGKPMINYIIDACKNAGIVDIIVVVGHKADVVKKNVSDVEFVLQNEQLGTGHAVMCAQKFINDGEKVLVLNGDLPLITSDTLKKLIETQCSAALISTVLENPKGYGRILRNGEKFLRIVEDKDLNENETQIKEINTGVYLFDSHLLKTALQLLSNDNAQGEYYLTDALEIIKSINDDIKIFCCEDSQEFFGVNDKIQLAYASALMQKKINETHMRNGVTIINPDATFIENDVKIGRDTIIYPNTFLHGETYIGQNCVIGPNSQIFDSQIFNDVNISYSVVLNSMVKNKTKVGPFAYIRPNCIVDENVKVGDFVELKNSNIGSGTKISHLTYVGDSDVGQNINFGCGTVTVNYDGKQKFRTTIEDGAFIGCNTNLIAPVNVGKNSYIAAGSTITQDVPENSLAIARQRQINKNGWKK